MNTASNIIDRVATRFAILCLALLVAASDQIPGPPQKQPVALTGATLHTVSGDVLEDATLVFADGVIVSINGEIPADAEVIDATGKHVYPGLFEGATELGLVEIGAVRATRDQAEVGVMNPNVRAEVAVNPGSELIPTNRANGILLSTTMPRGGVMSGQAAVLQLDGWTYEDMTLRSGAGMLLNWPNMRPSRAWWIEESAAEQLAERDRQLRVIEDALRLAKAYAADEDGEYDARWDALKPVLTGEMPLLVRANDVLQIEAAVAFAAAHELRCVIVGGRDALQCAALLAANDVPVVLDGVHRNPARRDAPIDEPFTLPAKLKAAGVKFAISSNRGTSFDRNLPYHAATAAAFGLSEADAIAAITLWPAQIYGVDDRVGSLEVGKHATLFVADGDILAVPTQVERAWINGRVVDLTSRHTMLNEKYKRRLAE
ncbi:MAG: amidohydrolase family protein [Planctomycetota bacterium]